MSVIVIQADRDAAAGLQEWDGSDRPLAVRLRDGRDDDHPLVQAFARHRLAERERIVALIESYDTFTGDPAGDGARDGLALNLVARIQENTGVQ